MSDLHQPVMLEEVIRLLDQKAGARIIDGTLGDGGHSAALLESLQGDARILGIDLDTRALSTAKERLTKWSKKIVVTQGSFRDMGAIASEHNFEKPTGILLDLGIRSAEIEESGLGFSFLRDEPLCMRFDGGTEAPTAASILSSAREQELVRILRDYGEEKFARSIAQAIIDARKRDKILRTTQLVEVINSAVPFRSRHGKIHPATRTFQALRIAVNDELGALEEVIPQAMHLLVPGGRLVVISFHSLEDRIVKTAFRDASKKKQGILPIKKPLAPTTMEVAKNPRARSAKLRVFEKTV